MTHRAALIPARRSPHGPVTAARLRRTAALYAIVFVTGTALAVLASSPAAKALGLGLVVPGGGFLVYAAGHAAGLAAHVGLTVGTLALFAVALILWSGSGNVVAPTVVWLGTALWAASMRHAATWPGATILVPGAVLAAIVAVRVFQRVRFHGARARGEARNRYLADARPVDTPTSPDSGLPEVEELSREDLSAMRFLLDRALQPVDEFNGYSWIEQFQTSSMRYQLMMTSYVLSLTQWTRLPAFHGYLSTAQLNLIEKTKLPAVWGYWKWENAVGNLRFDADPMAPYTHDNVMYSGWYAAMVGMYASNTGDHRYDLPGSITLRHPRGREYVYDWPKVVGMLADNFDRSDFTLFPCEPNWIYPLCNTYAGIGLRIHDRLRGTGYWTELEADYRRSLDEEFTEADGRLVVIRSSHTGFTIPGLTSVNTDAGVAIFQHALLPDVARRTWEILRRDMIELAGGRLDVRYHGTDFIDLGNYVVSRAGTLASLGSLAAEMGDTEVVKAAREAFDGMYPPVTEQGTTRHPRVSINSHLLAFSARANRANGMHDLVTRGMPEAWQRGPVLAEATYPYVLVAKAVSDGQALTLVLYPGHEPGRHELGLARLTPGNRYRCEGAVESELLADAEGRARLQVDLEDRREVRLLPVL